MTPDESKNEQLLISELAARAGVSVRTIRYYIDQGLLPSPQVRGRYSVYDEDYLDRLKLIRRLKEAYLPLNEIRSRLETLSHQEVRLLLEQDESEPEGLPGKVDRSPGSSPEGEANSAMDYIAGLLQTRSTPKPEVEQFKAAASPKSRFAPASLPAAQAPAAGPKPPAPAPTPAEETTWKRLILARGIELHYQEPTRPEEQTRIEQLIHFARNLFTNQARKP